MASTSGLLETTGGHWSHTWSLHRITTKTQFKLRVCRPLASTHVVMFGIGEGSRCFHLPIMGRLQKWNHNLAFMAVVFRGGASRSERGLLSGENEDESPSQDCETPETSEACVWRRRRRRRTLAPFAAQRRHHQGARRAQPASADAVSRLTSKQITGVNN